MASSGGVITVLTSTNSKVTDLGKPTMRGIRKCPKCGTINGTRGLTCKNKACKMVFKEAESKTRKLTEAVRLYTEDNSNIFSVRLRDKGPDYRNFVHLVMSDIMGHGEAIDCSQSHCHVEQCQKPVSNDDLVLCPHISACVGPAVTEAIPVMLRTSALNDLNIRPEIKHEVYSMQEQCAGPLVQRVSKHVFCVKCEPDQKHSLGYLHICFMEQRTRDGPGLEWRFYCSCAQFKGEEWSSSSLFPQWTALDREREPEWRLKRCIHFYSCLCAFAGDPKLREEFRVYLELDDMISKRAAEQSNIDDNQVIAILGQDENGDTVQVEVVNQAELRGVFSSDDNKNMSDTMMNITEDIQIEMETPDGRVQTITVPAATSLSSVSSPVSSVSSSLVSKPGERRRVGSGKTGSGSPHKKHCPPAPGPESDVSLTFHQWLASVTERINQTMHYQFDGHPEPLVFHAPQVFFDCLRERISLGSKKKRLPNSTTAFVRKDALPLGTFTKYTWSITNVLHVKQIFDTPHLPLEISRTFVENKDGSYSLHTAADADKDQFRSLPGKKIKAYELKTFLKVGQTNADQKDPTPFQIEWIPDILPFMKIGELRIKFEYGHERNGHLEQRICCTPQISDSFYQTKI